MVGVGGGIGGVMSQDQALYWQDVEQLWDIILWLVDSSSSVDNSMDMDMGFILSKLRKYLVADTINPMRSYVLQSGNWLGVLQGG